MSPEISIASAQTQIALRGQDAIRVMKPKIERTIKRLDLKLFDPDPIAGPHFSRITSVMSSAYKRHGYILERAILETLRLCPHFEVWHDPAFQVPSAVDHIVAGSIAHPTKLIGTDYPYSEGERTLQVDAIVFNKNTGTLGAYEIKRGFGPHDSRRRRSMLEETLCIQVLLKSYAKQRGYDPKNAFSHIIFFYGKCSIPKPFAITGAEMDQHFGWPVYESVDEVNKYFHSRLFAILSGLS
jgi:hypothetical protein